MALHSASRVALRTATLSTLIHAPSHLGASSAAGQRWRSSGRHGQSSDGEAGGGGDRGDRWRSGFGQMALGGGGGALALVAAFLARDSGDARMEAKASEGRGERTVEYVIVGGGLTAAGAVKGIRESRPTCSILVLCQDPSETSSHLSKEELQQVEFEAQKDAHSLDADQRVVRLYGGGAVRYISAVLLATDTQGGVVMQHSLSPSAAKHVAQIGVDAHHRLPEIPPPNKDGDNRIHMTIVGGGVDSCVLSAQLASQGVKVTLVCQEATVLAGQVPKMLGQHLMWLLRGHGVEVLPFSRLQYLRPNTNAAASDAAPVEVFLRRTYDSLDVRRHESAMVLLDASEARRGALSRAAALGSRASGIEVSPAGHVIADSELSLRSGVYAAGLGVSSFHPVFGRRAFSGADHRWESGLAAGRNMAGGHAVYGHVPQHDPCRIPIAGTTAVEMIGLADASLDTVSFWSLGRWLPLDATAALSSATDASASTDTSASVAALSASVIEASADKTSVREASADKTVDRRTDEDAGGGLFGSVRDWRESISRRSSLSWGIETPDAAAPADGPTPREDDDLLYVGPREGVVWYLQDGQVVGAALLNMPPAGLQVARKAIQEKARLGPEALRTLLPVAACDSGRTAIMRTTFVGNPNAKRSGQGPILNAQNNQWTRAIFGTTAEDRA